MHAYYHDLLMFFACSCRSPQWFGERGVPRFCEFNPENRTNVYAKEIALAEIACQSCGQKFLVEFSFTDMQAAVGSASLRDAIEGKFLDYGDPPNVQCCAAGPTMTSEMIRVVQFWRRDRLVWTRDQKYEVDLQSGVPQ